MARATLVLTVAGLLALAAAGCGGGESEAKQEFVAEANAICERVGTETEKLADKTLFKPDRPNARSSPRTFKRRGTALQREALADLRALTPPEGDSEQVARIWNALERAIDALETLNVDEPGKPGGPIDDALGKFEALASEYGLDGCLDVEES